jgi:hypothetical protein
MTSSDAGADDRADATDDQRGGTERRGDGDADAEDEAEDAAAAGSASTTDGDTFGVGIHVTESDLQFVVHVPSDIDSGWTDPDEFQRLVERVVWERLDQERVLRAIAAETPAGETVTLGRVTLRPDGTVVGAALDAPGGDADDAAERR